MFLSGRSFYTTRFGKRSETTENIDSTTESTNELTANVASQEIPENPSPRYGSSFYTTRFGRRSDPLWNVRNLKPRPRWEQDDLLSDSSSDLDGSLLPSQQLLSMNLKKNLLADQLTAEKFQLFLKAPIIR